MTDTEFDLFVSYRRTPDAKLAQEIKRFLEAFHDTPGLKSAKLRPLRVCVDGFDFSQPPDAPTVRRRRPASAHDVVARHLIQARELLVLCSEAGAASGSWIEKEVDLFLDARGAGRIRVAFSEGDRPWQEPQRYMAKPLRRRGFRKALAYDLRGYDRRRARDWHQVPDLARELVRLAADLHGRSANTLYPLWLEAELERTRRVGALMTTSARLETFVGDPTRAVLTGFRAHEMHPSDATSAALRDAFRVAVFHHQNRRETATFDGRGPAYLAGRWKRGHLHVTNSPDGRFRVLVTERGGDGPTPPGDVYLSGNETLRTVLLRPPKRPVRRVEDVAFDRTSSQVFVVRQFELAVYDLSGALVEEFDFSRFTKAPIHLVRGRLADRFVLGACTKGGVWLVALGEAGEPSLEVHSEWYRDATLEVAFDAAGNRAALVYETGKMNLLDFDHNGRPRLRGAPCGGTLSATFLQDGAVAIASIDGTVRVLDVGDSGQLSVVSQTQHLGAGLDGVTHDAEADRLAVVGTDHRIRIVDRRTGALLEVIHFPEVLDALHAGTAQARTVVVPEPRTVARGPVWQATDVRSLRELPVTTVLTTDRLGAWCVAKEGEESTVYRLTGERAERFGAGGPSIKALNQVLMVGAGILGGATAFQYTRGKVRALPTPRDVVSATAEGDGVWLGTSDAGYRIKGQEFERMTPEGIDASVVHHARGGMWLGGKTGALRYDGRRLVRVTAPSLSVREFREAGGHVWLVEGTLDPLSRSGPSRVYRSDGLFSTPLPGPWSTSVSLFDAEGAAWLAEPNALTRIRGDGQHTAAMPARAVDAVQVGATVWARTSLPSDHPGPLCRLRADTLEPVDVGPPVARLERVGDRVWVLHAGPEAGGSGGASVLGSDGAILLTDGRTYTRATKVGARVWGLTPTGAFVLGRRRSVAAPVPAWHYWGALALAGDEQWLLATQGAVRVAPGEMLVCPTGVFRPREVLAVGDARLVLTRASGSWHSGPAFHAHNASTRELDTDGAGVSGAVWHGGHWWLLLERDGVPLAMRTAESALAP